MRLDGRARGVEPIGDLLERAMCRKETEDPQLGRCAPVVLPAPDPLFETPDAGGKRSGIGISLQSVARELRAFKRADRVAEVEADLGAAQREIDIGTEGRAKVPREAGGGTGIDGGVSVAMRKRLNARVCRRSRMGTEESLIVPIGSVTASLLVSNRFGWLWERSSRRLAAPRPRDTARPPEAVTRTS
jgi:hypothetical protein